MAAVLAELQWPAVCGSPEAGFHQLLARGAQRAPLSVFPAAAALMAMVQREGVLASSPWRVWLKRRPCPEPQNPPTAARCPAWRWLSAGPDSWKASRKLEAEIQVGPTTCLLDGRKWRGCLRACGVRSGRQLRWAQVGLGVKWPATGYAEGAIKPGPKRLDVECHDTRARPSPPHPLALTWAAAMPAIQERRCDRSPSTATTAARPLRISGEPWLGAWD